MATDAFIHIRAEDIQSIFYDILLKHGLNTGKATACAEIFTSNSVDGVYTHGVNRFPVFVQYLKEGIINKEAEATRHSGFGGLEQWNGNLGPGPLNAIQATERACLLANEHGIGCVALANTNHWMRGGYYGWLAAKKGYVFIGWSNTIANMPAWNAVDSRLGNNPLVMALPYNNEAIVLDMAMSQFSFGTMEMAALKKEKLPVTGGLDKTGRLTDDPAAIIESRRPLPIGYWKGAGLSLLLDILAAILSGGLATHRISGQGKEYSLSQVFICIDMAKLPDQSLVAKTIHDIIEDYQHSEPEESKGKVTFPGERVLQTRKRNLANGIPVLKKVWEEILKMS